MIDSNYDEGTPVDISASTTSSGIDLDAGLLRLGYSAFRPKQREAIETLLREQCALLVAPTGGGKSLTYQLPATLLEGTTLVVSPLVSLMHDQVHALHARGVRATYLAATLDSAELRKRLSAIARGEMQLVYVTPERLCFDGFRSLLERILCPLVAIDEAHCISQWGHDFRPEYLQIREVLGRLPSSRVLACTATATPIVRDEILDRLGLPPETPQLVHGFARPNLALRVRETERAAERRAEIDEILKECVGRPSRTKGTAILYAPTRRTTEEEAARLVDLGWKARAYHAGMPGSDRERTQYAFAEGELDVVVATNAFGMGIDRSDVRAVVHLAPPDSIEAYYQEAGRAGRDGQDAVCLLLVSPGDVPLRRRLIEADIDGRIPDPEVVRHKWNLFLELMRWAEGGACRHDAILRYFGDEAETLAGCGRCDNCLQLTSDAGDPEEVAIIVRKALCAVARIQGRFGIQTAAKLLRGAIDERLERTGLDETPTFGSLSDRSEDWLVRLLRRCVTAGWIDFSGGDRPVVSVTAEGRHVIHGRRPARLLLPSERVAPSRKKKGASSGSRGGWHENGVGSGADNASGGADSASIGPTRGGSSRRGGDATEPELDATGLKIFEALRAFRLERARSESVPPYVVASDRTLRDLALLRPGNMDELLLAHGIGPSKAAKYGAALLEVIRGV